MKHIGRQQLGLLRALLLEAGLEVGLGVQNALLIYLDQVIEANQTLNLTRITDPKDAVRLHLVDSLLALPEVNSSPEGVLLDLGTGGGFPGVPLCLAGDRAGVLLDSVGKKARAVNAILREMGAPSNIQARQERAEDHAREHRGAYSVVTARAVSELPALVELSAPLLSEGGLLVALKGSPADVELDRARVVASLVGMRQIGTRSIVLPGGGERRCVIAYELRSACPPRFPRRTGEAQNSPLA